ncbi:hypothetical protein CXF95_28315 [Paraglaciecola sp. MB-3u-78]|nr:hypothetical protein CXF95_28315 [Paraglaciecola sp. MB-3u-78]
MSFERKLEGHICSDNAVGAHKISFFVRLRTLAATAFFMKYVLVFHPTGHLSDVQNGSRPFCLVTIFCC